MGALYKARHPTLDRVVLLKKLTLRGGSQFVERFKREARLMMDFKNDHIVQVYDHFKEGPLLHRGGVRRRDLPGRPDPPGALPLQRRGHADPLRGRARP